MVSDVLGWVMLCCIYVIFCCVVARIGSDNNELGGRADVCSGPNIGGAGEAK